MMRALTLLVVLASGSSHTPVWGAPADVLRKHCQSCHAGDEAQGGLDLDRLPMTLAEPDVFAKWVKIYDRIDAGEMPPKTEPRLTPAERADVLDGLKSELLAADSERQKRLPRGGLRRLTRTEYEQTMRDLFEMPGLALQNDLPPDGTAHGFDKHRDALDLSHVNLAKYIEVADRVLKVAIAVQPTPPTVRTQRISLANPQGFVAHVLMNGDGVLLKNGRVDPEFPAPAEHNHLDQGAHERMGSFENGASVGLFRHEDESFHPYFNSFVAIYPARYRLQTSLWSFQWDQGKVLPGRGVEAARFSIVTLTGDGRGGGHPSSLLTHLAAPPEGPQQHEITVWLNQNDTIGFNTASLAPAANYYKKRRAMEFTGPGIVCDYLIVEGPFFDSWPPPAHKRLFGDLPLVEFKAEEHPGVRPPAHEPHRQKMFMGKNVADPVQGIWTIASSEPEADADRLLAAFLPRAFRRPVPEEVRRSYVERVRAALASGECFETAMRRAYLSALCSPDFLFHVEAPRESEATPLEAPALACRLAYFLWNSLPDERLTTRAADGQLSDPAVLREEVERMLQSPKAQRFIDDFLGQWLKLKQIAATDPDRKLYPEFSVYLQDSMVAETRAYFRELLERDLDARHLVLSDFAMLNEKLAVHYGLPGVSGPEIRRVPLPADSPRGPFLTQASLLKITANGTTTSPVPRGAFVMDRLLGQPPELPPANVAAVEPDVRGATTIREQLAKHRDHAGCAACHARLDPPGFALEAFDVIGGQRGRYRSIGAGDPPERGSIDPFIGLGFRLGPAVDASGVLPDGRAFQDVREYQRLIAADSDRLLRNLAHRLTVYATGREVGFRDRAALHAVVEQTQQRGGGVRTLIHQLIRSPLFQRL